MLAKRTLTGLALAGTVGSAIFYGPRWAPAGVIGLLVLAGAWEWAGLVRGRMSATMRLAYVGLVALAMWATWGWVSAVPARLPVLWCLAGVWWIIALWLLLQQAREVPADEVGIGGGPSCEGAGRVMPSWFVAAAGLGCLVPAWIALGQLHLLSTGPTLLLTVIALTVAADTGAYFVGRLLGRRRLVPRVSPGKTVEGLVGGLGCAAAVSIAILASPLPAVPGWPVATMIVAMASVLGDLTVSLFKRNAGVKHSGHLLPGHGGVLDRIDSFCAAAPAFALWLTVAGEFP